jgi:hypothetical protein
MEQVNDNTPNMPPKVAHAITEVMKEVPKLAKSEKNSHGNYNFASIDDFLEAVRPLCAKHGLIISQDEESFEMSDGWLVVRFAFTLAHSSGETWAHRPRRTIMVSAKMGSQAFGAAQSYCLKQFERSLFQIATGEKGQDADEHAPADLPNMKKSPPGISKFRIESREFYREMHACTEYDQYVTFVGTAEAKAFIKKAQTEFPDDWNGNGQDVNGIKLDMQNFCNSLKSTQIAAEELNHGL